MKRLQIALLLLFLGLGSVQARLIEEDDLFSTREAKQQYEKAKDGLAEAQFEIAERYREGKDVHQSLSEALEWYEKAARQGHVVAQYWLGVLYQQGKGAQRDDVEAVKWFQAAAEKGFPEAQYALGMAYSSGRGVIASPEQSVYWLLQAANAGSTGAQYVLALIYRDGIDRPIDEKAAFDWALKAAQGGELSAQNLVGQFYERGFGTSVDLTEAQKWYRLAAQKGDADAQLNLGALHLNQATKDDDRAAALEWIMKAVEQDQPEAQYLLGMLYWEGLAGLEKAPEKAALFVRAAAAQQLFGAEVTHQIGLTEGNEVTHVKREELENSLWQFWLGLQEDDALPIDLLVTKGGTVARLALNYVSGLESLAASGSPNAGLLVGLLYDQGRVLEKNPQKALFYYHMAAESGSVEGQYLYAQALNRLRADHKMATAWYLKAAQAGHPQAQWALAQAYDTGNGVEQSKEEAFFWAKAAAEREVIEAQHYVASGYHEGVGTAQDFKEASHWLVKTHDQTEDPRTLFDAAIILLKTETADDRIDDIISWLEKSAARGFSPAKLQLGLIYHDGMGVLPDGEKARQWALAAENDGIAEASVFLGEWALQAASPDWETAIVHFRKGAQAGNADAQYFLGLAYVLDKGGVSEQEGVLALISAAEQNDPNAQLLLGRRLIAQNNWAEAKIWLEKAAEQQNAEAQFRLGYLLLHGFTGEADSVAAMQWFEKAAEAGFAEAMYALGDAYATGYGATQNLPLALKWFEAASTKGFPAAQYRLGEAYEKGLGVKRNLVEAKKWYQLAADQRYPDAMMALEKLNKK